MGIERLNWQFEILHKCIATYAGTWHFLIKEMHFSWISLIFLEIKFPGYENENIIGESVNIEKLKT